MKKMVALLMTIVLLVGMCSVAGAAAPVYKSKLQEVLERGYLIVGTGSTNVPWHSVNENGEYEGFDIDMAAAIADKLGLTLEVKQMDFELLVSAVAAGTDCDIAVAGMGVTDERLELVDFSDLYYSDELAIAVLKTSGVNSDNYQYALEESRIAVQTGTTGEAQMKEDFPHAQIVSLAKTTDCFAGLLTGEYAAVCTNAAVVNQMISATYSDAVVVKTIATGEEYAIAVSKDDAKLKAAINEALAELTADGTLADLLAKWGL